LARRVFYKYKNIIFKFTKEDKRIYGGILKHEFAANNKTMKLNKKQKNNEIQKINKQKKF
jgi:hypothetical protein